MALGGGEYGALINEGGELDAIYSKEARTKKVRNMFLWGFINASLCGYITFMLVIFWRSWRVDCVKKLNIWLLGYLIIQGAHLLRTIILIHIWRTAKDPSVAQIKVELFYGAWIFLAEAGWLIYGNTFIYEDEIK